MQINSAFFLPPGEDVLKLDLDALCFFFLPPGEDCHSGLVHLERVSLRSCPGQRGKTESCPLREGFTQVLSQTERENGGVVLRMNGDRCPSAVLGTIYIGGGRRMFAVLKPKLYPPTIIQKGGNKN